VRKPICGEHIEHPLLVTNVESRVGDVPHSQADSTLLRSLFPSIEPVDFVEALEETIEWMRGELDDAPAIDLTELAGVGSLEGRST